MNLVFMGTPAFAVESLRALHDAGHTLRAVFTRPDKPRGRGMKTTASPVKEWASARDIPVFQPVSFRDGQALDILTEIGPALLVVVAYGRSLPEAVLRLPPLGAVNVHASLLPRLRGAAPIQWSVIRGEATTGVTTMHMAPELDAGDIILSDAVPLAPDETAGTLTARLAPLGAALLVRTLDALARGDAPRTVQDASWATFAPPITKEMRTLDFSLPCAAVERWVRGLSPEPGAVFLTRIGPMRVFQAAVGPETGLPPGWVSADAAGLQVTCGDGRALSVLELQAPGGRRMRAADYLRGHAEGIFHNIPVEEK